jgi:putative two-component system response regulator
VSQTITLDNSGRVEFGVLAQSAELKSSQGFQFAQRNQVGSPDVFNLMRVFEDSVRAMGQMMEVRDPYTAGHQARVSHICVEIANLMGLPAFKIKGLELAAMVHDVGKLAIPSEILSKPGQLTRFEFDLIKTHVIVGYDIIKNIEFPWPVAKTILQHHERINGSGYPGGLSLQDILP